MNNEYQPIDETTKVIFRPGWGQKCAQFFGEHPEKVSVEDLHVYRAAVGIDGIRNGGYVGIILYGLNKLYELNLDTVIIPVAALTTGLSFLLSTIAEHRGNLKKTARLKTIDVVATE